MRQIIALILLPLLLATCGEVNSPSQKARILTMGDSLLATHQITGRSVSDNVENVLGEPVVDRSVIGAHVIYNLPITGGLGLNISKQFLPGRWDWIILNGGGNDLWLGCGCTLCNHRMERLISRDGRFGQIPNLIASLRATGAKVIYVGYLRSPGVHSPVDHCRSTGDELERRVTTNAASDDGVFFVSLQDLVPSGDTSFHAVDMIHPSFKGSAAIGNRIAQIIKRVGQN